MVRGSPATACSWIGQRGERLLGGLPERGLVARKCPAPSCHKRRTAALYQGISRRENVLWFSFESRREIVEQCFADNRCHRARNGRNDGVADLPQSLTSIPQDDVRFRDIHRPAQLLLREHACAANGNINEQKFIDSCHGPERCLA